MKIYKFELGGASPHDIDVDMRAGLALSLGVQRLSQIVLWAEQDMDGPVRSRHFHVYYTGDEIPDWYMYIGTVTVMGLVCHVYEHR